MRKNSVVYLLSILFFILLSGCVDIDKSTSDNTKVKAKKEDANNYQVYGQSYHVIGSSKNYSERGVASWYGRHFHRKRTSSGERYNMYKMTAAHKTLPLSTYVSVTNLTNGRHVVVRVNDRGPFVSDRLIDLSYAAAKKLGMVGRGLAQVEVKAVNHKS